MRLLARHVLIVLGFAFLLGAGVLAAAPYVRMAQMPDALRYAPSDSANIVYAPELDAIWSRLSEHGELIASLDDAGADTVAGIASALESTGALAGLVINDPNGVAVGRESLEAAGVGFDAPFMVAFRGPIAAGDFVALIPVNDAEAFQGAMSAAVAERVDVRAVESGRFQAFESLADGASSDLLIDMGDPPSSIGVETLVDNGQGQFPRTRIFQRNRLCSDELLSGVIPSASEHIVAVRAAGMGPLAPLQMRAIDAEGRATRTRAEAIGAVEPPPQEQSVAIDGATLSTRIAVAGDEFTVRLAGANACYVMLDERRAIVFSRLETFEETLRRGGAKRALASQRLFTRGLRITEPRDVPLLGWAYLRQADPSTGALSPMIATFGGDDTALTLRLWSAPHEFYSQRVRSVLGPSGLPEAGGHSPIGSGASASISSGDLTALLQFADSVVSGGLDAELWRGAEDGPFARYRPVVRALIDTPNVTRMSVSIVGMRERVPQFVLRATLPQADADSLVLDIRRSQQRARDRALLARAAQGYEGVLSEGGWRDGVNGRLLLSAGRLAPEDGTEDGWRRAFATQPPTAFAGGDYNGCLSDGAGECRQSAALLFPPFTANDEALLAPTLANRDEVIRRLREGRYRVATTYRDGAIWVAPDLDLLRDALSAEERGAPAAPAGAVERRLHIRIDPRWLNSQRRLDGGEGAADAPSEGEEFASGIESALRQFSIYESVELTFDVLDNDNGIVIDITARR